MAESPTIADGESSPRPHSRSRRLLQFAKRLRPRFMLRDLLWLSLLAAVLMTWYRDHHRLADQLAVRTGVIRTSWSIKQILGAPNTPVPGDQSTAWASQTPDSQLEWVIVEFPRSTEVAKIDIFETYNPGAVVRICSVAASGSEKEIWRGADPTPTTAAMGKSVFSIPKGTRTRRVKIYIDSPAVNGWNEIDAIGLHGRDGGLQWASDAWASSSFGDNQEMPRWFWP